MLGLRFCLGFSLAAVSKGYGRVAVHGFLIAMASLAVVAQALGAQASEVAARGSGVVARGL